MANNHWVLEVICDLKAFAFSNGLDATARALEQAKVDAIFEIGMSSRNSKVTDRLPLSGHSFVTMEGPCAAQGENEN
jgi:hypothetical protein